MIYNIFIKILKFNESFTQNIIKYINKLLKHNVNNIYIKNNNLYLVCLYNKTYVNIILSIMKNTEINLFDNKLFKKYPHNWNCQKLSKNSKITEKFILDYPNKDWNIKYLIDNNKITDFKSLSKFKNINDNIINKYPDKPWDWDWLFENTNLNVIDRISLKLMEKYEYKLDYQNLSKNKNLTEEFIMKYPYKNWNIYNLVKNNKITDFNILSKFKNINQEIINKYPDKPWDWDWLFENTNLNVIDRISLKLMEKYEYELDYQNLSKNKNLTEEFIMKYPYKNWNIYNLVKNNKITDFNILSKFKNINDNIINKYPDKLWDWDWLFENTNLNVFHKISLKLMEKYEYKLDYQNLSKNKNLTEEFIMKYPYKNWNIYNLVKNNKITDFNILSKFKNINQEIINKYPDKLWDWDWLFENTNLNVIDRISLKLMEKYEYELDYQNLSKNKNLTEKFIMKYPYKNWNIYNLVKNNKITDFNILSKFKNINQEIINKYPDKLWDWDWLFENTNLNVFHKISLKLIEKYEYELDYQKLSKNKNLTEEFIMKYPYKNWIISYLIQNNKIKNYKKLSIFNNINKSLLQKYKNKPWDWDWMINNKNIKIIPSDIIKKYNYKLKNERKFFYKYL